MKSIQETFCVICQAGQTFQSFTRPEIGGDENATAGLRASKAAFTRLGGIGGDVCKLVISCTITAFDSEHVFGMYLE